MPHRTNLTVFNIVQKGGGGENLVSFPDPPAFWKPAELGKWGIHLIGWEFRKKRQKSQTLNSFSTTLIISNLPCCHYLIILFTWSEKYSALFMIPYLVEASFHSFIRIFSQDLRTGRDFFGEKGNWRNLIFKRKVRSCLQFVFRLTRTNNKRI